MSRTSVLRRPICSVTATGSRHMTDDQAMAGVKAGSSTAFGVLHDRYQRRAYLVARSICRDEGRAQEAVQEAFMSIWTTARGYQDHRGLSSWLMTVVRNRAIDSTRRNRPHALNRASDVWLNTVAAQDSVYEQGIAGDLAGTVKGRIRLATERMRDEIADDTR